MTFDTFDQSDEETLPDQKKYNDKDKDKDSDKDNPRVVTFETLIKILTIENLNSLQSLLPYN